MTIVMHFGSVMASRFLFWFFANRLRSIGAALDFSLQRPLLLLLGLLFAQLAASVGRLASVFLLTRLMLWLR